MSTTKTFLKGAAIFWYVAIVFMGVGDGAMIVLGHILGMMGLPARQDDGLDQEIPLLDFGLVSILVMLIGGLTAVLGAKDKG